MSKCDWRIQKGGKVLPMVRNQLILLQLPCPWVRRGCSGREGGGSHLPSASAPRGGVLRHTPGAVHLPGSTGVL